MELSKSRQIKNLFDGYDRDQRMYYFDIHFLKVEKYQIIFRDNIIYAPISKLVNSNRWWLNFYEYSFLSRIFPADNIKIVLVK